MIWLSARNLISWGMLCVLAVLLAHYVVRHWDRFELPSTTDQTGLLILALLNVVYLGASGYFLKILAAHYLVRLRVREWFGLSAVTALGNYLLPLRGGVAIRAVYLRQVHGLPYAEFLGTLGATSVMNCLVNALLAIASIVHLERKGVAVHPLLVVTAAIMAGGCLVALFGIPRNPLRLERHNLLRPLVKTWRAWDRFRKDLRIVVLSILNTLAALAVLILRIYFAFRVAGGTVGPGACVILATVTFVAQLLSLTPGSLGIREGAVLLAAQGIGVEPERALMATGIDRAMTMLSVFTMGPLFSSLLGHANIWGKPHHEDWSRRTRV